MDPQFLTLLVTIYVLLAAVRYDVIVRIWDALHAGVYFVTHLKLTWRKR